MKLILGIVLVIGLFILLRVVARIIINKTSGQGLDISD